MTEQITLQQVEFLSDPNVGTNEKVEYLRQIIEPFIDNPSSSPKFSGQVREVICSIVVDNLPLDPVELQLSELQLFRIMLRQRNQNESECFEQIACLLFRISGINFVPGEEENSQIELILEAERCLVNLMFQSVLARSVFEIHSSSLLERINFTSSKLLNFPNNNVESGNLSFHYLDTFTPSQLNELLIFDLKIAFLASALSENIQEEWCKTLSTASNFTRILESSANKCNLFSCKEEFLSSNDRKIMNETLKILFNIFHFSKKRSEDQIHEIFTRASELCVSIIRNNPFDVETHQNSVNILATIPDKSINFIQKLSKDDLKNLDKADRKLVHEGSDVRFVNSLLDGFLQAIDQYDQNQIELLGTFLTLLIYICENSKEARRFCRMKIIPPLKAGDVERRPDQGNDFRNKIVRLIMSVGQTAHLASEFLYILCKKSVSRMIKYCGFGHSAGLLANRGLLGGLSSARRSSDSEDSETEDYKRVEEKVDPVTGHIPSEEQISEWKRMINSMSDEQKEYEVMKLVNCMDKLADQGIIAPGTIDEDGKPRQVKHIAELIENIPSDQEHSDSD